MQPAKRLTKWGACWAWGIRAGPPSSAPQLPCPPKWRRPDCHGRGYGELLLVTLTEAALDINARWLTLEVRVSNAGAQSLYRKYGFREAGTRKRYYTDNNEDALIMWTDELHGHAFQERYRRLKERLMARLESAGEVEVPEPS